MVFLVTTQLSLFSSKSASFKFSFFSGDTENSNANSKTPSQFARVKLFHTRRRRRKLEKYGTSEVKRRIITRYPGEDFPEVGLSLPKVGQPDSREPPREPISREIGREMRRRKRKLR